MGHEKRDRDESEDDQATTCDQDVADVVTDDALSRLGGLQNGSFSHGERLLFRNKKVREGER
jgi:hypothetical protein